MSNNRQLAINMIATVVAFAVSGGISFFLTPFIVKHLGAEAYGFIGLSNNIIGYTSLVTIALNAMAGRFISLAYMKGDIDSANKYFSSVFYSNTILGSFIAILSIFFLIYINELIEVPSILLHDVRLLFTLLVLNSVIGLVFNMFSVATFIKNRLDLNSIRGIVGNIISLIVIFGAFYFYAPHVWYLGLSSLIVTIYNTYVNYSLKKKLTPDLVINISFFDWNKVLELIKSGIWNVVSKLSAMLETGFDLVIANVCISAAAMGTFALTKNLPFLILSLFGMISGVFAPNLTKLYADNNKEGLLKELNKTIRILGFFANIPLVFLFVFGDNFYSLWLPTQDSTKLQILTLLGTAGMTFAMPLEALWNIFTITNKLKYSSLTMLLSSSLTFVTVLLSMYFIKTVEYRLLLLAGARSLYNIIRTLTFLPIYGAYCLDLKKTVFFAPMIKSTFCFIVILGICYTIEEFTNLNGWLGLSIYGLLTLIVGAVVGFFLILSVTDRKFLLGMVLSRIK